MFEIGGKLLKLVKTVDVIVVDCKADLDSVGSINNESPAEIRLIAQ